MSIRDGIRNGALAIAGTAYTVYDIASTTAETANEKGAAMGVAQAGKTTAKHATAMLWFAVGSAIAVTALTGGLAGPFAAAALGAVIATGGTIMTHQAIDEATPDLL